MFSSQRKTAYPLQTTRWSEKNITFSLLLSFHAKLTQDSVFQVNHSFIFQLQRIQQQDIPCRRDHGCGGLFRDQISCPNSM